MIDAPRALDGVSAVVERPWLLAAVLLAAFAGFLGALAAYQRARSPHPESIRKAFHIGSGLLTLAFPFLFESTWPVILLAATSAAMIAATRWVRPIRDRFGKVAGGVERTTIGELYFPASVATVFWLARDESPLLFCIPILVLTLADAVGALVGVRYGQHKFEGSAKSFEGSLAVVVAAFFCVHVPLLLWTDTGRAETLLIAGTLALLVMLLEGSAWRGLDNLFVPIGGFFLLQAWLPLDAAALTGRFAVTCLLLGAVLLLRRRSTLGDAALLAGAFFSYLAWAIAGWPWLVAPAAAFGGYAWMSPRTPANSRRIHDVAAVIAVWAFAVVWLVLAKASGDWRLVFPFTLVFAGHTAIFGTSRMASDFPQRSIGRIVPEAMGKGWLLMFVPFLLAQGASTTNLVLAVSALAGVALSVALFLVMEPSIRRTSLEAGRWVRQAVSAGAGSIAGWVALRLVERAGGG